MSLLEFNLRIIIYFIVAIIGVIIVGKQIIPFIKHPKIVIIIQVIAITIGILIILSFLVWKPNVTTGVIVEKVNQGRWPVQFYDDYNITLKTSNGKEIEYSTPIFNPKKIGKKVENLKIGKKCTIKSNKWNILYDIECK